ncbi:MAG: 16S rRNA (guanine(527)-N(7))-methyltransferase RsmG [Anaerolineales bacterium]|nr:16S rRNA (guanine(527)-N(7))-methyltransferase RsmG [Anaerolineae bacterium]PWB49433.1 MAG: 16S rRNA (guanine(527)-N(7))-methyltransferase RsmG [Anaerolineales bacterium]
MKELALYAQQKLDIHLTRSQLAALSLYERELLDWNTRFNLTAIRNPHEIHIKHFLDSLTCLLVMRESAFGRFIDVGTGAGFPGIPIKILYPKVQLTLVESVGKKAEFCRHVVKILALPEVEVVQERAEVLGQDQNYREQYDWAVARAVAILPVLAEYLLPLVRVGGTVLAMKGESGPAEAHAAEHALRMLGGHLRQLLPVTLPGVVEERYLVVIDKVAATPAAYPRKVGMPAKQPL